MKHSIPRLAALLMALALGAAACGSSDSSDAAAPAVDATQAESAGSGDAASSVLDISATAADGTAVNLSDYAGQDLMLWFWAPW